MPVTVVAELGINHNGDPEIAEEMIDAAQLAGCGAVKVQSYRCADFLPRDYPDWDLLERCEIWPHLKRLASCAHDFGLQFGVTASSVTGVGEAVDAGADYLKNASDAILRLDIIKAMVDTGLPVWVSTGMASPAEIDAVPSGTNLMLCTSMYPCPDIQVGLDRLGWGYKGFSDHTVGVWAAALAVTYNIEVIEKHFTLDHDMNGPDHGFSANPDEMAALVDAVRRSERIMGSGELGYMPGEEEGRSKWRMGPKGELRTG